MMEHGADIYTYAKKMNCKPSEVVDFSSNINFNQPAIKMNKVNNLIIRYADGSYNGLKKVIGKRYKIKTSKMALYNGATSAIFYLLKYLRGNKVYLYAPIYGEYEKAVPKRKETIKINRFEDIYIVPEENSIVVFSNPSTPDGKYYNLQKLFKLWKKQNCTVILDESFIEFENLKSYRSEIDSNENLYIIQSFSKFNSCPGVRIGAVFSNKKNIQRLQTPLWNLSSFDVAFLTNRLKDIKFKTQTHKLHEQQKEQLKEILQKSNLFEEIHDSNANFFLVKSKRAKKIFNYLLKHKILVRSCESFDYLDESYLRFSVKDKRALKLLSKSFDVKLRRYVKPKEWISDKLKKIKIKSFKFNKNKIFKRIKEKFGLL